MLILHGYRIPQFQNFVISPAWLLVITPHNFKLLLFPALAFSRRMASYLGSHEIMWHNKRSHGLKLETVVCFYALGGKKVKG